MSITVTWDNAEKNSIYSRNVSPWTWEEFEASQAEIRNLILSVSHTVDVIIDISEGGAVLPNAISRFTQAVKNSPANHGSLVFIGGKQFDQAIMQAVGKLAPAAFRQRTVYFVATREEARALLQSQQK